MMDAHVGDVDGDEDVDQVKYSRKYGHFLTEEVTEA